MYIKEIKDVESKILKMRIISKEKNEEKDKQARFEKLNIYQQYKRYKSMINVYTRQKNMGNIKNILKINDPSKSLENFLKIEGLDPNKDIDEYREFKRIVDEIKSENPEVDLRDVTSSDNRKIVSDIINKTQGVKELCPADLDFVAVIEGFGLYKAMSDISQGKDRQMAIKENDITEEMLQKGETRLQTFNKKGIKDIFKRVNKGEVDPTVLITAGALEIAPGEAQSDLESFGVIKSKEKEPVTEECLLINRKEPALNVMDAFYRKLGEYAPNKTNTEMVKKAIDDYLNGIEQWNKEQEAEEAKYRRNNNGKPSPRFMRELKEYQKQKAREEKLQKDKIEVKIDDDREIV